MFFILKWKEIRGDGEFLSTPAHNSLQNNIKMTAPIVTSFKCGPSEYSGNQAATVIAYTDDRRWTI